MILEIRINGSPVDLAPKSSVSWERISPYFIYDDIFADKVEIPSVPVTSRNRQIFDFIDVVNRGSEHPRFGFEKYVNGQLIQEGIAFVSDVDQSGYKITVVERLDEFFGDIHSQLLTETDLGSVPVPLIGAGGDPLEGALVAANGIILGSQSVAYFPTILNTDYYGDKGSEVSYTGIVNEYEAGAYLPGPKTPMPTVFHVLRRIGEVSGVTITGDFFNDNWCARLIHYTSRALDNDTEMILNRFVPEMTPPQYIIELRKLLNLSLDFNTVSKTLNIGFTDDIFAAETVLDWSDKLVKGSRKVVERNRRLQLSMTLDQGDALMKDKPAILDDYLTPAFADDLGIAGPKTQFSTLLTDSLSGLPITKQAGSTSLFGMLPNRSAPRLLLWTGATLAGMDPDNIPVALPYFEGKSLYWNGAGGLKETRWQKTEAMRRNMCYLTCELNLNEADLATFDFKKKVHINGMDYLPLQIGNSFPLQKPTSALLVQV
jgi:hypothetical protein